MGKVDKSVLNPIQEKPQEESFMDIEIRHVIEGRDEEVKLVRVYMK